MDVEQCLFSDNDMCLSKPISAVDSLSTCVKRSRRWIVNEDEVRSADDLHQLIVGGCCTEAGDSVFADVSVIFYKYDMIMFELDKSGLK